MCASLKASQQGSPVAHRYASAEADDAMDGPPLEEGLGESSCDSSASDGSLEDSELSSSSSSGVVSIESEERESDAEEQSEEVSSSSLGASQPGGQPPSAADDQAAQSDCPPAMLPSDWLALHAIPTTHDLEEALRSNGRLAYVPSSAAPAIMNGIPDPSPVDPKDCPPAKVRMSILLLTRYAEAALCMHERFGTQQLQLRLSCSHQLLIMHAC